MANRLHLIVRSDGTVWSLLELRDGTWTGSTRYRPRDLPTVTNHGRHTESSILALFAPLGGTLEILQRFEIR